MQDPITAGMKEAVTTSLQKQADENRLPLTKQTTLTSVKHYLDSDVVQKKFQNILKGKSEAFMASIISLISSSTNFDGTSADSIIHAALVAASLDVPINPMFGFAHIIPYNSKDGKKAQFQMGYKGFIQLALRTNQYHLINATEVYEGELVSRNRLTGQILLDEMKRTSDKVMGYASYFRLINGFEKTFFMSTEEIEAHAKKYSQSYNSNKDWVRNSSKWTTDFGPMAIKTVIKLLLSKYGILSVELQKAIQADQAVVSTKYGEDYFEYPDNEDNLSETEATVIDEVKPFERPDVPEYFTKQFEGCTKVEELEEVWKLIKKEVECFDLDFQTTVLTALEKKKIELQETPKKKIKKDAI